MGRPIVGPSRRITFSRNRSRVSTPESWMFTDMERGPRRDSASNVPRHACVRGGRSKDGITPRQGLLAALLALAMIDGLDVRGAVGGLGSLGARSLSRGP